MILMPFKSPSVTWAKSRDVRRSAALLIAVGRRPNTDDLGFEKAGIEPDSHGYIKTDARLGTSVPGVWALGDVKGGPAFTHISFNDYQIVLGNLTGLKNLSIATRIFPYAVFTAPELGRIGMTEREARESKRRLKVGKIPMEWVARAVERDEAAGHLTFRMLRVPKKLREERSKLEMGMLMSWSTMQEFIRLGRPMKRPRSCSTKSMLR
jgi:pyruvate/2-oxoglutarate dehydrogenase complex dihydrolipoamide dehydrogenase (E3) component